jgi:hypothetical protein
VAGVLYFFCQDILPEMHSYYISARSSEVIHIKLFDGFSWQTKIPVLIEIYKYYEQDFMSIIKNRIKSKVLGEGRHSFNLGAVTCDLGKLHVRMLLMCSSGSMPDA